MAQYRPIRISGFVPGAMTAQLYIALQRGYYVRNTLGGVWFDGGVPGNTLVISGMIDVDGDLHQKMEHELRFSAIRRRCNLLRRPLSAPGVRNSPVTSASRRRTQRLGFSIYPVESTLDRADQRREADPEAKIRAASAYNLVAFSVYNESASLISLFICLFMRHRHRKAGSPAQEQAAAPHLPTRRGRRRPVVRRSPGAPVPAFIRTGICSVEVIQNSVAGSQRTVRTLLHTSNSYWLVCLGLVVISI